MAESDSTALTALVQNPKQNLVARFGVPPGNPGNRGGQPGRSGRRPNAFNAALRAAAKDPKIVAKIAAIALGEAKREVTVATNDGTVTLPASPSFNEQTQAARTIYEYGIPKDERQHEVNNAIVIVFQNE